MLYFSVEEYDGKEDVSIADIDKVDSAVSTLPNAEGIGELATTAQGQNNKDSKSNCYVNMISTYIIVKMYKILLLITVL